MLVNIALIVFWGFNVGAIFGLVIKEKAKKIRADQERRKRLAEQKLMEEQGH